MILEIKENREVIVHSIFPLEIEIEQRNYDPLFSGEIEVAIRGRKAYAASDAAMKYNQMGGYWKIINTEIKYEISNTLYHKEWGKNTVVGAEVIVMLELLVVLEKKGKNINEGKVIVGLDNRKVCRGTVDEIKKMSMNVGDAWVEIVEMKETLNRIQFDVEFKLTRGHEPAIDQFNRNSL